jgi:hypothetical protein
MACRVKPGNDDVQKAKRENLAVVSCSMAQNPHPHLAFAQRHSKSVLLTLNAFTSLCRIYDLLSDLDELDSAIKAYEAAGNSKGRRLSWFEITSYYPVGFVTCLEWHARSRLVDLLSFRPSAIRSDDLKGQVNDKLLAQMAAEDVTIPQLMGAMTTVGSSEKYLGIFNRLFSELGINPSVRDVVNPIILKRGDAEVNDALQRVFEYRNSIVHEIDFSTIGPWLVRNSIDVDEARDMGSTVRNVIEAIEKQLSRSTPKGFPNRLDEGLLPEDELEYLDQQIAELENEITMKIRDYRTGTGKGDRAEDWLGALEASRLCQQTELDFISNADFIVTRHFDFKRPLKIALRRQRMEYLKRLLTEL